MPGMKWLLFAALTIHLASCFVQFQIMRNPHSSKKLALAKSECQDPATISSQVKYSQACYDKDIAYVMEFDHLNKKKYLSLDFTSPISWIKDQTCKTLDNNKPCTLLKQSLNQKFKGMIKQKVTALIQKLKKQIQDDDSKAIIQGSNEVVMGEVDQVKNLSIVGKNHDHFTNLIDVFLLGLYVIGENDSIVLNTTNFIRAHKITPNLNSICDGAISLRLDEHSQESFLDEVFKYMKSAQKDKIISIYLGNDKKIVTIGGFSQKYAQKGLSSFTKVKLEDSDDGRLPHIQGLIFQSNDQQTTIQADNELIFTLSSSYIGFTKNITEQMLKNFFPSTLKCKVNSDFYIQCSNEDEEDVQTVKSASLDVDLDTSMIHFEMKDLIKSQEKSKIVFNIKQIECGNTIMGEPFFLKYYIYFDYHKNEVAFAPRKLTLEESFMTALTLIHFVILTLLLGCCFLITSHPCKKIYYHFFQKIAYKTKESVKNTIRSYQPIFQDQEDKQPKRNNQQLHEDVEGI